MESFISRRPVKLAEMQSQRFVRQSDTRMIHYLGKRNWQLTNVFI